MYAAAAPGTGFGPSPYPRLSQPMHRTSAGKWILGGVAALVIGIAGLLTLAYVGFTVGIVGVLLGGAFAILPVPIIVLAAIWMSRFQPQPWGARLFALGWGATVAVVAGLVLEIIGGLPFGGNAFISGVVNAPLAEESCKGIAVLLIFGLSKTRGIVPNAAKYFTGPVDGIAYAMFVGAGFAFSENILYLGRAYQSGQMASGMTSDGLTALVLLFLLRCVALPFGHPLFTSATGLGLGLAARNNNHLAIRLLAPTAGWFVAVLAHGTFNAVATLLGGGLDTLAIGYVLVLFPMFLVGVTGAVLARSFQFRAVGRGLAPYVAGGWIKPAEITALSSLRGRGAARRWARRAGGAEGVAADQEFQFAATRLAILRDAAARGIQSQASFAREEAEMLAVVARERLVLRRYAYRR